MVEGVIEAVFEVLQARGAGGQGQAGDPKEGAGENPRGAGENPEGEGGIQEGRAGLIVRVGFPTVATAQTSGGTVHNDGSKSTQFKTRSSGTAGGWYRVSMG